MRSHDSKVKELVLEQVDTDTVSLHSVLRELERNNTVTTLTIDESMLSRENFQQLNAVLHRNTAQQHLTLCKDSL
jgi:hypothetical protein